MFIDPNQSHCGYETNPVNNINQQNSKFTNPDKESLDNTWRQITRVSNFFSLPFRMSSDNPSSTNQNNYGT
jgi:hypothetical protein